MNDLARRLRAQKPFSTDPDYLERMAREAEAEAGVAGQNRGAPESEGQPSLDLPPKLRG